MMNKLSLTLRSTAMALAVVMTAQAALPTLAEANFWADRKKASDRLRTNTEALAQPTLAQAPLINGDLLPAMGPVAPQADVVGSALSERVTKSLPDSFLRTNKTLFSALSLAHGTVRKVLLPSSGKIDSVVIHIQDVHLNQDAQHNIAGAIQELSTKGGLEMVGLEAAWEPIETRDIRAHPRRDIAEKWADILLKANRITGPGYLALAGPVDLPPLLGVDDKAHYFANGDAFRQSSGRVEAYKKQVADLLTNLRQRKAKTFGPDLLKLDHAVMAYHEDKLELGQYVKVITHKADLVAFPATRQFLLAQSMEDAMDFKQVDLERRELIDRFSRQLSPESTQALIAKTLAYREGKVRYSDFYDYLSRTAEQSGISLPQDFPAMDQYVKYVLAAEAISAEDLYDELIALEEGGFDRLSITPAEKLLVEEGRKLALLAKLVDFSLTTRDWKAYQAAQAGALVAGKMSLGDFENFYKEAYLRDQYMAENLIKFVEERKAKSAVLVTGGFHAEGLEGRLLSKNIAVVSFVPKIETLDDMTGAQALSIITQEKTPLAQLLGGERLFLSGQPLASDIPAEVRKSENAGGAVPGSLIPPSLAGKMGDLWVSKFFAKFLGLNRRDSGFATMALLEQAIILPIALFAPGWIVLIAAGAFLLTHIIVWSVAGDLNVSAWKTTSRKAFGEPGKDVYGKKAILVWAGVFFILFGIPAALGLDYSIVSAVLTTVIHFSWNAGVYRLAGGAPGSVMPPSVASGLFSPKVLPVVQVGPLSTKSFDLSKLGDAQYINVQIPVLSQAGAVSMRETRFKFALVSDGKVSIEPLDTRLNNSSANRVENSRAEIFNLSGSLIWRLASVSTTVSETEPHVQLVELGQGKYQLQAMNGAAFRNSASSSDLLRVNDRVITPLAQSFGSTGTTGLPVVYKVSQEKSTGKAVVSGVDLKRGFEQRKLDPGETVLISNGISSILQSHFASRGEIEFPGTKGLEFVQMKRIDDLFGKSYLEVTATHPSSFMLVPKAKEGPSYLSHVAALGVTFLFLSLMGVDTASAAEGVAEVSMISANFPLLSSAGIPALLLAGIALTAFVVFVYLRFLSGDSRVKKLARIYARIANEGQSIREAETVSGDAATNLRRENLKVLKHLLPGASAGLSPVEFTRESLSAEVLAAIMENPQAKKAFATAFRGSLSQDLRATGVPFQKAWAIVTGEPDKSPQGVDLPLFLDQETGDALFSIIQKHLKLVQDLNPEAEKPLTKVYASSSEQRGEILSFIGKGSLSGLQVGNRVQSEDGFAQSVGADLANSQAVTCVATTPDVLSSLTELFEKSGDERLKKFSKTFVLAEYIYSQIQAALLVLQSA